MLTRRSLIVTGMGVGIGAAVPDLLRAAPIQTNFDIVPVAHRTALAIDFDVPDWTNISQASHIGDETCFTCHTIQFNVNPLQVAQDVAFQCCLAGDGLVNLVSYTFDTTGAAVYDKAWLTAPIQRRPQFSPDNRGEHITTKFNSVMSTGGPGIFFTIEVKGAGLLYMGRLIVDWLI
jgi:hypothetical protein